MTIEASKTFYSEAPEVQAIERLYEIGITQQSEVLAYLGQSTFLLPLLQEAFQQIKIYLPESQLFLELVTDPEIPNDSKLVVFISPKDEPEPAFEKFKQFQKKWWLIASKQAKGQLYIMPEYR